MLYRKVWETGSEKNNSSTVNHTFQITPVSIDVVYLRDAVSMTPTYTPAEFAYVRLGSLLWASTSRPIVATSRE
jgi:hypothetical protein